LKSYDSGENHQKDQSKSIVTQSVTGEKSRAVNVRSGVRRVSGEEWVKVRAIANLWGLGIDTLTIAGRLKMKEEEVRGLLPVR